MICISSSEHQAFQAAVIERDALRAQLAGGNAPPPECQTEAEKTAFAFGWWGAMNAAREQLDSLRRPNIRG